MIAESHAEIQQLIGGYANDLKQVYDAAQHTPKDMRLTIKKTLCAVLKSRAYDGDFNDIDPRIEAGARPNLFYECLSVYTDRFLNDQVTPEQYVADVHQLQTLFKNWGPLDDVLENKGVMLAAASRTKSSVFYGQHKLMKNVYKILQKDSQYERCLEPLPVELSEPEVTPSVTFDINSDNEQI